MSINFGQFPTPRLPLQSGDFVVGYQLIGSIPTLAQYTMTQLFSGVFPGGTVPASQGGTGRTTLTANGVLIGEGTNPVNSVGPGTLGQMLISQGAGVDPAFANNPILSAAATAVTGNGIENSTQVATDQFVNQQIIRFSANVPLNVAGGGVFNQAVTGTGLTFVIFSSGGVISSVLSVVNGGTGYAVGDMMLVTGGNFDARVRITNVIGGVVQSGGVSVMYGGTGYTTGASSQASDVPPGQRTITLTGILTSNITYILANGTFNNASRRPEFVNNTTGAFTITVKISNGAGGSTGAGVVLPQGTNNSTALTLMTDGSTDVWIAETPLGIGAVSSTNPVITGGTINNTTVGATTPSTGAFTTLSSTGNFTPSQTNGIVGTTTNNNANAGSVGEFVTATASGVSLTSTVVANVTSISLTAGDWDVTGVVQVVGAAGTTFTNMLGGSSTTSATLGPLGSFWQAGFTTSASATITEALPPLRYSFVTTTTVFAVADAQFTVSTATAAAVIRARRIR
jgi:hypothetical protein